MSVALGSRSPRNVLTPRVALAALLLLALPPVVEAQRTAKPVLHGRHWMAITGKPLGATAGARMFHQGGNAVDAAAAMLAATSTMWDVLSWGGETQALIYHPGEERVIGVNALGVAPSGATPDHYRAEGHDNFPPEFGPLSAVTPGTPRRAHDDARRMGPAEPRRRPPALDRDGGRIPDRSRRGAPHPEYGG